MKKLLILPLLVLLTACVQYYYPETAMEDGVYYAEDDPKYVVYQGGGPGAVYYPWYSLDYFYLGYNPYPIYPYHTGFPFGLMYGYGWSPWWVANRYYSHHSLVYGYGPYYRGWRSHNGHCATCWRRPGHHAGGDMDGLAGNSTDETTVNHKDFIDGVIDADSLDALKSAGGSGSVANSNYIVTLPPGYVSSQGMIIRRNESTKTGRDKVEPISAGAGSRNIVISAAPSTVTAPASALSSRSASVPVNRPGPSNRRASASSQSAGRSAPRHSSRSGSRSRSGMSVPRSRPSKSRSSRPARDID